MANVVGFADTSMIDWAALAVKPDLERLPLVAGYRILIRPFPVKEKSTAGIIMPDLVKEKEELVVTVGLVLDVGPLAYTRDDMLVEGTPAPWCEPNDVVIYGKYAGKKIMWNGQPLVILNDDEVIAVVPKK